MGGIFSAPKAPPPPPPPPVMPTPDDAAIGVAKKKATAKVAALGGRESTFLTSPFGGTPNTGTKQGGG
jgi:hypothetical protein